MKKFICLFMTVVAFTLGSCSKDDDSTDSTGSDDDIDIVDDTDDDDDDDTDDDELTGENETFEIQSVLNSDVSGTVTFKKHASGATTIEINLDGTSSGSYPVHLHNGSTAEDGAIAIILNNVDGDSGVSITKVSGLDDGTPIDYSALIAYDGYISVYTTADFDNYLAKGDIGINQLTGESVAYNLNSITEDGIEGTATIHQRISGAALVEIKLEGTTSGNSYPAHIHFGAAEEGGNIVVTLEPVKGGLGTSTTQVEMLEDETPVTYDDLIVYDGHINVHLSAEEIGTIVTQGNIGANAVN